MNLTRTLLKAISLCSLLLILGYPTTGQTRTSPVTVGEKAPDFTLESHQGTKVTLSDSLKKTPVVLVFYRGYW